MISSISESNDLAAVLNAEPATTEDAAETPRDWLEGIWVGGTNYPLDAKATTETLAVLADGTAAAVWSPKGEYCKGDHRTGVQFQAAHWCVADVDSWTWGNDIRGVIRDWRTVRVWDANGHSESDQYPTLEEAKAAFTREVEEIRVSSAPQAEVSTVRDLLAQDAATALTVSLEAGMPSFLMWDGDLPEDWQTVVSREEVVDELGEKPTVAEIEAYLPELQELIDSASQKL